MSSNNTAANVRDQELRTEHLSYLGRHPEVREMMAQFLAEVLMQKPSNVYGFAAQHFQELAHQKLDPTEEEEEEDVDLEEIVGSSSSEKKKMIQPLVICGPSGVGKGTLISRLKRDFSGIGFSVSHTTRNPREGEVNGVHYHFVSKDHIQEAINNKEFVEHAIVHGNIYGTSITSIKSISTAGKICVLDIDVQGVKSIKASTLDPKVLYVAPPSHAQLEERLRGRGTETEEAIAKRLANALTEMEWLEQPGNAHHTIVNDDLEEAYKLLKEKLVEWYPNLLHSSSAAPKN